MNEFGKFGGLRELNSSLTVIIHSLPPSNLPSAALTRGESFKPGGIEGGERLPLTPPTPPPSTHKTHSPHLRQLKYNLLIAAILLLAFTLRIAAIEQVPAGLSHDEAYNGIAAMQVLNGYRPIFFEINKGIEPLIIYLEALAFYFFGIGPVQLRLVNIFAGVLTVALIYPLTVRLFNRRIALLAMAGVAVSFWPIFVSRLTLRAVLLPPLLMPALYLFWRALIPNSEQRQSKPGQPVTLAFFALSGLVTGIAMYTYLSSRFVPFIMVTLFAYRLICGQIRKIHWLGLLLFFVIWAAVFFPLASFYGDNAESFTRRSNQVTTIPHALNGDFEPMLRNTLRTLGMFTFWGDTTDRYNLDARPLFDWINGLFFYVGVGLLGWRLLQSPQNAAPSVLLLTTAFFMLVPDFITDDSPHFLRTIGAMPVVYMLWAVGAEAVIWGMVQRRGAGEQGRGGVHNTHHASRNTKYAPRITLPAILATLLVVLITLHTAYDYFIRWNSSADARHIYGADIAEVARYLKTAGSQDLPVISAEYYRDLDRFRMDLHFGGESPFAIWFDGRQSLAFPPPESGLSPRYIFPNSAKAPELWTSLLQPSPDESGYEYTLYHLSAAAELARLQADAIPVKVNVNDDLRLTGYLPLNEMVTGKTFKMVLIWQALRSLPPGTDYTFLVQLQDNRGHVWVQTDGNGYDPADWQPGIVGLQLLTFRLPGNLPPLKYHLLVRVVNRQTGRPLPASNGDTTVSLGAIVARLADTPRDVDPAQLPNPILQNEAAGGDGTGLLLRGYDLNRRTVAAGDHLTISLHWQVGEQPEQNYRLQFTLEEEEGREVYRWPAMEPLGGEWSTKNWPPAYWVSDKLDLAIGAGVPTGSFTLRGWWVDEARNTVLPTAEFNFGQAVIESVE